MTRNGTTALIHLEGTTESPKLIFDRVESDNLRECNFDIVIGRQKCIFNHGSFLVFILGTLQAKFIPSLDFGFFRRSTRLFQQTFHIGELGGINTGGVQTTGLTIPNVHEQTQDSLDIFLHIVVFFHMPLEFLFHAFATALGSLQDFIVGGRNGLSLKKSNDIGGCSIGNGEVQGGVVVIVLLGGTLGVGVVESFDDFEGRIVVSRIMER
mmetsp:Transcript_19809/g.30593  ORF Transcript_19809/g.30593 Transcript_19809/m.30593 type:complete len:210 (+) Transcript_19809:898-1527(+)